jgi:hypothetical protein
MTDTIDCNKYSQIRKFTLKWKATVLIDVPPVLSNVFPLFVLSGNVRSGCEIFNNCLELWLNNESFRLKSLLAWNVFGCWRNDGEGGKTPFSFKFKRNNSWIIKLLLAIRKKF